MTAIENEVGAARKGFQQERTSLQTHLTAAQIVTPDPIPIADFVQAAPVPPQAYRTDKLQDSEVFYEDRDHVRLRLFKQQMKIKLLGNADRFPTLRSQLFYTFSPLEGVAANQFLAYTNDQGINLESMNQCYKILDTSLEILVGHVQLGGLL